MTVIFGIWPGVAAADLISFQPLDCPAEDTAKTLDALRQLQGMAQEFYVRAYRHFGQGFRPRGTAVDVPGRPGLYAGEGRMIDLVASYQSPVPDPPSPPSSTSSPARPREPEPAGQTRRLAASPAGHPGLAASAGGIGSASAARPGGAGKRSAKYWVSCVTRPPVNSMTLTEYEGTPS